jgi:adenylate cyclase
MERRLTAILAADVVGYSRLMGLDEAGTLAALKLHRRETTDVKIAEHQGRIVKLTGDGLLAEFPSVVNAVACAAEIQRRMRERNAGVPEDRRIEFRIGVNVGDVIVEDKAFDVLERLLPNANPDTKAWARNDSDFVPLPSHPRWQTILKLLE